MKFITLHEVLQRTALTRSTMYRLMDAGRFPAKVSLGGHAIAWDKCEVEAWMEKCVAEREKMTVPDLETPGGLPHASCLKVQYQLA